MELFFGVLFTLLAVCVCLVTFISDSENAPAFFLGVLCLALYIVGFILLMEYHSPSIAPIDVYRGKTTLEITYRDSIAIDSVVVWKEEVK